MTCNPVSKISIITPTKNRCALLRETVQSVLNQTYPHWEHIIVDDESTDNTAEIFEEVQRNDPRIRFMKRQGASAGANVCRNQGIKYSTGDYVIFLDSDDLLAPSCFENRFCVMEKTPELDFAVFPCEIFNKHPGDLGFFVNIENGRNDLDRFLELDVPWANLNVIYRRNSIKSIGAFDEKLLCWQDMNYHIRVLICKLGYKKLSGKPDCFYRYPVKETHDRISYQYLLPDYLESQIYFLSDLQTRLSAAGFLNQTRRQVLGGRFFSIIQNLSRCGKKSEAEKAWFLRKTSGLLENLQYLVIYLFL